MQFGVIGLEILGLIFFCSAKIFPTIIGMPRGEPMEINVLIENLVDIFIEKYSDAYRQIDFSFSILERNIIISHFYSDLEVTTSFDRQDLRSLYTRPQLEITNLKRDFNEILDFKISNEKLDYILSII